MNGFTNTILSMLLSWLKALIMNVWALLSGGEGEGLYQFLSNNWMTLVLILCVGGFVVDRVVYFFRWRPDYVWRSKLRFLRGLRKDEAPSVSPENEAAHQSALEYENTLEPVSFDEGDTHMFAPAVRSGPSLYDAARPTNVFMPASRPAPRADAAYPTSVFAPASRPVPQADAAYPTSVFAPASRLVPPQPDAAYPTSVFAPASRPIPPQADAAYPTSVFAPASRPVPPQADADHSTNVFAPAAMPLTSEPEMSERERTLPTTRYAPLTHSDTYRPRPVYAQPSRDIEPVFDESINEWDATSRLFQPNGPAADANPSSGMIGSFGAPMPEPIAYLRDMHASFEPKAEAAPLYTPPIPPAPPAPEPLVPVHPGLNSSDLQYSFKLMPEGALLPEKDDLPSAQGSVPSATVPVFMPYAQPQGEDSARQNKLHNPFANIAKKARSFVSGEDEDHRLTIRDMQQNVDMHSAFHEPVYPKPKDGMGEEV